jgi:hypothetical protein
VLDDIGAGKTRLTIRSGHGVGKTALLAWIVLWFMCTHYPCKVGCTAPTTHQLEDVLWPEIGLWLGRLDEPLRSQFRFSHLGLALACDPVASFAVGRTARPEHPEAWQGLHSKNALVLVDEASGVDDRIFDVALGVMSTPGAITILAGNPTRLGGYFFDTHGRLADRWACHHVDSETVPRARGHVADIVARHGRESNVYRVRVAGEFPLANDDAVISRAWCEAAIARGRAKIEATAGTVWGLDVARFGDDRSALAKRAGNVLLEPVQAWQGYDTMQTAGRVLMEWNKTEPALRPRRILVDAIGLGAGVVDRLNEERLPVTGVNVGEAPLASERYARLRDELWFRGRNWLQQDNTVLPADPVLVAELTSVRYSFTSSGKYEVESKEALKRRGHRSPDLADALLLTFAGGEHLEPVTIHERARRGHTVRGRYPGASWMAM